MPEVSGVELIAAERLRQQAEEGHTAQHDRNHFAGDLARAAAVYATPPHQRRYLSDDHRAPVGWPWHEDDYKPGDRLRELVKAGALIAAEIDRSLRLQEAGHAR